MKQIGYNYISPYCSNTEPTIGQRITEKLIADMAECGLMPGNKVALTNFFKKKEMKIRDAFNEVLQEDISKWNIEIEKANEIIKDESRIEKIREEIASLQAEKERLENNKKELEEKFSNPTAREAFLLWNEILKPYQDMDDCQLKRNVVLSAGKVVAAAFGYKEETNNQDKKNDTERN